uniref:F-box/LRR-repeat protein 15-like leucin rich repeat domain-containing protein n=1 Tax=Arundo donax TaxID=35708 RepID=A0A0A9D7Y7_ARUDO
MLQRDAGAAAKRCKTILVGGVETEYVPDSESDDDGDCVMLGEVGMKMPAAQLPTGPSVVGPSAVWANMDSADETTRDDPARIGKEEIGDVGSGKHDPLLHGESLYTQNLVGTAVGGVIEQLPYPIGSPETEMYADMYFKEELRRYKPRKVDNRNGKLVLGNNNSDADADVGIRDGTRTHIYSPDSKGKEKMVVEDSLSSSSSSEDEMDLDPVDSKEIQSNSGAVSASIEPFRRQAARERAIRLAPKFAFFKADNNDEHSEDDDAEDLEPVADPQDWPGLFSTAARIYEERDAKLRARELNSSKLDKSAGKAIRWSPSKDRKNPIRAAPSLTSLCLNTLADHAEGIESLEGIPEELKYKLLKMLCRSRKMNAHLLNELLCDSPAELQLSECSWLSEDDFEKTFGKRRTENLQVLQFDISGRCMPDYILPTTLAMVPNCMPLLTKISLKGNYRLSDKGLDTIISAAPSLSVINLCECSLLTSSGIEILANKLHSVLRELYIDDCINVEAMMILPALQKIKHLEVLSMSGILSVCDKFVSELIPIHGSNMRELAFAGCSKLTSSSIRTIGGNCPQLSSLDLRNLNRLRDSSMRHLRNGCRQIKKLKLQRNTVSDEAVSQYLEESGGCLTELMLNNVEKAGDLTALAIASKCSARMEVLDLSFCRELTNEALGLIVDSCSSLRILKLFGCTQITDFFLKGHSNPSVKIIGIEGSILEQMDTR